MKPNSTKTGPVEADKAVAESQHLLAQAAGIDVLRHIDSAQSSITTSWGVAWDEIMIARDLLQNFRDASQDNIGAIRVETIGNTIVISGPVEFDLQHLFFVGSEKGKDDIGQYGEGFKVAAVCLMRDFNVYPIVVSGASAVRLRLGSTVGTTSMQPLVYDYFEVAPQPGTRLILQGCRNSLVKALERGLDHFLFAGNRLLGKCLWESYDDHFLLYESTTPQGHVFYRKLLRAEIAHIPIILVINKEYDRIERKISTDRDRKAFGEEVLGVFYSIFTKNGIPGRTRDQAHIVQLAKSVWTAGHPLLSALADTARDRHKTLWPTSLTEEVFGKNKYFARARPFHSGDADYHNNELQFRAQEREWRERGLQELPAYFSWFGVQSAYGQYIRSVERAHEEARTKHERAPSQSERRAISLLYDAMEALSPHLAGVFKARTPSYHVIWSDTLLGELRQDRAYNKADVYLSYTLFTSNFSRAFSVFLHEHAHVFGWDGRREFTDALTDLMEQAIEHRQVVARHAQSWEPVRAAVQQERAEHGDADEVMHRLLSRGNAKELRAVLAKVPADVVRRALGSDITKK